jgi:hypothetical protein
VFAAGDDAAATAKVVLLAHDVPLLFDDRAWRRGAPIELAPATYVVLAMVDGHAPQRRRVEVTSDCDVDLVLQLDPAPPTQLTVRGAVAESTVSATIGLELTVRREQEIVWRERRRFPFADAVVWPVFLPVGAFQVQVRDVCGASAAAWVELHPGRPCALAITLR